MLLRRAGRIALLCHLPILTISKVITALQSMIMVIPNPCFLGAGVSGSILLHPQGSALWRPVPHLTDKAQGSEGKRHVLGWHILLPFNMPGNRLSGASGLQSNCLAGGRGSGEAASAKSRSGLHSSSLVSLPRGLVHGEVTSAGQGTCPAGAHHQGSLCLEGEAQRQDGE